MRLDLGPRAGLELNIHQGSDQGGELVAFYHPKPEPEAEATAWAADVGIWSRPQGGL